MVSIIAVTQNLSHESLVKEGTELCRKLDIFSKDRNLKIVLHVVEPEISVRGSKYIYIKEYQLWNKFQCKNSRRRVGFIFIF